MGLIENIYETMNLRITETAFELHLRKVYPTRNILSMRETETISGQECLDVQKKTDGSVNIIGEVATDPVASWMIQSAQVASKFTLFTHHAKTFPNLVTALRNSMLRAGVFKDEKTAEEQVVQVLNFDIHLQKDFRGRRYIERVTECIPVEEKNEYTFDHNKEKTLEGKLNKFFDNATIFFTKTTNRELYKYRNVLEFVDDAYVFVNPISEQNIREMRNNMDDYDVVEFDAFLEKNWGIKPPKMPKYDENGNILEEAPKETVKVADVVANKAVSDIAKNVDNNVESKVTNSETAQDSNSKNRIVRKPPMNIKNPQESTKKEDNLNGENK
jgi:pilus assembly protein CpaF